MTKTTSSAGGPKAARDRAVLIATYEGMVRAFRPKVRLLMSEIARMDNWQLERAARDLYNAQSTDAVNRFARKMRIQGAPRRRPRSLLAARLRLKWVMLRSRLYLARARLEAWWDRNYCYFMGVFSHDPIGSGFVPPVEESVTLTPALGRGAPQTFKVPRGVKAVEVKLEGAGGGSTREARDAE